MQTVENSRLSGVVSDEEITMLRQRNEERARQKIAELGNKWLLHRFATARPTDAQLQQKNRQFKNAWDEISRERRVAKFGKAG